MTIGSYESLQFSWDNRILPMIHKPSTNWCRISSMVPPMTGEFAKELPLGLCLFGHEGPRALLRGCSGQHRAERLGGEATG